MSDCVVCGKHSRMTRTFCSYECGDWALNNSPKLFTKRDKWSIDYCVTCGKKIYSRNIRKYCSPDCQRTAIRLRVKNTREAIPRHIRFMIFTKYEYLCVYCGEDADCIDHVFPVREGGRTIESNLVSACHSCNSIAGGRSFSDIKEKRKYILEKRNIVLVKAKEKGEFKRPSWHSKIYGWGK